MRLIYWASLTLIVAMQIYPWGVLAWLACWLVVIYSHTSKPRSSGAPRTEGTETYDASWPR